MTQEIKSKRKSHLSDQHHVLDATSFSKKAQFYHPTPAPDTVVVHSVPKKTDDACCWGCAAALCLCFGIKECCNH
ncbi:hypothetical protein A0J61_09045 [Choanephora cucurbitarum]|uniref:Cysteine-rich transmembrane CYSTM domain-containing protein n=1 Tax=Choanephora cucurbitarum TaxID=101091 RepID=A0A1C7N1D5_9FUNG|nr:hypothetical protein A0J61_09045 [Choanephora cucurbitarum]